MLFSRLIDEKGKYKTVYPHKETAKDFVSKDDPSKTMIIHQDNNSQEQLLRKFAMDGEI